MGRTRFPLAAEGQAFPWPLRVFAVKGWEALSSSFHWVQVPNRHPQIWGGY